MTVYEPARHCQAGRHCRAYDPVGQQPGEADRHTLCQTCLTAAEHAIRLLPLDWRDLEQLLPPAMGVWGEGGPKGASKEPPVPLNTTVEALQAGIWRAATAWEEVARDVARLSDPKSVVDARGVSVPRRRRGQVEHVSGLARDLRPGPVDVVRASRILTPRLGPLSDVEQVEMVDYPLDLLVGALERRRGRDPDARWDTVRRRSSLTYATVPGWLGVLDLAALHRRASALLGLTRPVRRLPGSCPAKGCGRTELRQDQPKQFRDEQLVYCGWCGWTGLYEDYRREVSTWMTAAA